jgi:aminocarboxymuconate-semialdehyde decarboxylase
MATKVPVVDVHSHIYPPSWISLLKTRTTPPYIDTTANTLVNRPGVKGKPLLPTLSEISTKIAFMDKHGIDISVLSLGNPWLDFLEAEDVEAVGVAGRINAELEAMCAQNGGRLFFFATLPIRSPLPSLVQLIGKLPSYPHCRGVVLGTSGLTPGTTLDSPETRPLLKALAEAKMPIFLHPNYGLPTSVLGEECCGQVLPVSLGFTTETTVAVTRLYLSGTFDEVQDLRLILSHAGGTLPFLAGRIESCLANFPTGSSAPAKSLDQVIKTNIYVDGITFSASPLRAAAEVVGADRIMFGTDHPLFPSSRKDGMYAAMVDNREAAAKCFGKEGAEFEGVMGGNACRVLKLKL